MKNEGINLKVFSELAGISYDSGKSYSIGRTAPKWETIKKISEVTRFKKYKLMLLDMNEDGGDIDDHLDLEFRILLDQLDEEQLVQVEQYMNFLLSQEKNKDASK